jgi:putative pyruvate formate lyase activating enzyme
MLSFQPAYLELHRTGELKRRAERALSMLAECTLCPRGCGVDRGQEEPQGVCRSRRLARVSSAFAHFGEENCLRGRRGSGTIFFAGCNLHCAFCQNWEISWEREGSEVSAAELAGLMIELQEQGCHNINFVSPSHVVAQILEALPVAAEQGLRLPLVYNSGGYDSLEALKLLDGVIDIYMPDFKFWESAQAERYCAAPDYPAVARQAIREMHCQVGPLKIEGGIAQRGLLLRHLVMPNEAAGTAAVLEWVAREVGRDTYVNIMAQYHPAGRVRRSEFAEIDCLLSRDDFQRALEAARRAGLTRLDRDPGE